MHGWFRQSMNASTWSMMKEMLSIFFQDATSKAGGSSVSPFTMMNGGMSVAARVRA
jgi:hypothetical protein